MKSKQLLIGILSGILIASCDFMSINDDIKDIQADIDRLERRMDSLENKANSDIKSLMTIVKALEETDYITSVETLYEKGLPVGYKIVFLKSGVITIHDGSNGRNGEDGKDGEDGTNGQDGSDGYSPQIGISQGEDGLWYWTLDGEWLTNGNGDRICLNFTEGMDGVDGTNGLCPMMKIEDGMWYISTDGGHSWNAYIGSTGQDGMDGRDGIVADDIFENIIFNENDAVFLLKNGTVISVPMYRPFDLSLSHSGEIPVASGEILYVGYTVSGYVGNITVSTVSGNGWISTVENTNDTDGLIRIVVPAPFREGKVMVFASDETGNMRVRSLVFTEITTEQ